ncbi:dihydroorotate dehydrogenase electron transfer subunit [Howardella ureilytica]
MLFHENVEITKKSRLSSDIYEIYFKSESIAKAAKPGQFINVYINDDSKLLPRPISICEVKNDEIRLDFRVVGAGTSEMASYEVGDKITVTGPIGNGYDVDYINNNFKHIVLFGGGIGIPPMLELSKRINIEKTVILGYRDELFLNEDFADYGNVIIASESGEWGTKGNVLNAFDEHEIDADVFAGCGPKVMLNAIKNVAVQKNIPFFMSLEERMACGVGACLACVCKTTSKDAHSNVNNARVCVDGPVFEAKEVEL